MTQVHIETANDNVLAVNIAGSSSVVLVCEHASHIIPVEFDGLGMSQADRTSHAAWDPGAFAVAEKISRRLDATLIASRVSRLVFDCNRPPHAKDAMPARSEIVEIPGNRNLSPSERDARTDRFYTPFHAKLHEVVERIATPVLVTIHSFTPIYHGQRRPVEIGILHDSDARLADAMLQTASAHMPANVQRNQPYGPEHGVTHTLQKHAVKNGHLNVMLEIRNDLIATAGQQQTVAASISDWLVDAFSETQIQGDVQCHA